MKRSFRTPALSHLVISWMAAVGTAAWALAGTADTPKEAGRRAPAASAASGPHSDGADAVLQTRQRTSTSGKTSKTDQQFLTKAAASGRAEVEMGRLGQSRAQNSEVRSFAERMVQDHTRVNGELHALGSTRGMSWTEDAGLSGTTRSATGTGASTSSRMGTAAGSNSGTGPGTSTGNGTGMGMGMGMGPGTSVSAASGAGSSRPGMGTAGRMDAEHPQLSAGARHSLERLRGLSGAEFDREFMKQMVTDHKTAVADFQRAASSASDPEIKSFAQKTLPGLQEHLQMARGLSDRLASSGSR